ncbi:MAG: SBBP repeat-containing protein [Phycisphaerae bacterium]
MRNPQFRNLTIIALSTICALSIWGCGSAPAGYVTLTVAVEGSGTVTPVSGLYPYGRQIDIQANPSSGGTFDHWEGALTGNTNPTQLTLTSDTTIKAVFIAGSSPSTLKAFNLTVTTNKNITAGFQLVGQNQNGLPVTFEANLPTIGDITHNGPAATYIPTSNYLGLDGFTYYAVSDNNSKSDSARVNIYVIDPALSGWAKSFGSADGDKIYSVASDGLGNIYVTGKFSGTVDFDPGPENVLRTSAGKSDVFLSKFSSSGEFLWVRIMGGNDNDIGNAVAADGSGNAYVVGSFSSTMTVDNNTGTNLVSRGGTGAFICKFASDGDFLWARTIDGSANENALAVVADIFGNVYVGGSFSGRFDFNFLDGTDIKESQGQLNGFITRFSSDGKYIWTDVFGSTLNDEITALGIDNGGNIFAAGYFSGTLNLDPKGTDLVSSAGGTDVFLVRLTSNGQRNWGKTLGSTGSDQPLGLSVNGFGDVVIGGFFQQTVDFDPGAASNPHISAGDIDGFVAQFDASGNFVWARTFGGSGKDWVNGVACDSSGNVYAVGAFSSTVDFDFTTNVNNKTSAGLTDAFATKITAAGTYVSTVTVGGPGDEVAYSVALGPMAFNIFWVGSFQQTAYLDPRPGKIEQHLAFGSDDCFLIRTTSNFSW